MSFRPLLAYTVSSIETLAYPQIISPKLDGIRAINLGVGLVSRTLKPIPNRFIQKRFGTSAYMFLDGELIAGAPTDSNCYRNTVTAVMTQEGAPEVAFYIFDRVRNPNAPFNARLKELDPTLPHVVVVPQVLVPDAQTLEIYQAEWLRQGYEGVMTRDPQGRYKLGRATALSGELGKIKNFHDSEAVVLSLEELQSNQNEKLRDERGYAKRSTHQDNLVPAGVLGAIHVRDLHTGVEFKIGTGFTEAERIAFWLHPETLLKTTVKYKSFLIGIKDKPRFPVFLGLRISEDYRAPA